jgi:hypothetical protein
MALRFGPKQAIDAFLPAQDATPDAKLTDPREPPHPDPKAAAEETPSTGANASAPAAKRPFSHFAPGRRARS